MNHCYICSSCGLATPVLTIQLGTCPDCGADMVHFWGVDAIEVLSNPNNVSREVWGKNYEVIKLLQEKGEITIEPGGHVGIGCPGIPVEVEVYPTRSMTADELLTLLIETLRKNAREVSRLDKTGIGEN